MLLTLLLAPAIWTFIAKRELRAVWFGWLSAGVSLGQILMLIPVAESMTSGDSFGLYQRLAYGLPLIWVFVFASILIHASGKERRSRIAV